MSAFTQARDRLMNQLMREIMANLNAEMLGLPLPYPPPPRGPEPNFDDPCDDWSQDEDDPDW